MLDRLQELQQRWGYRAAGVVVGLASASLVLAAPPEGLSDAGARTLAVAVLMAIWWLGAVLPITITALVPLVAFPLLGVAPLAEAAGPYAHPLVFLMLGGFLLGHAMETVGLHERLVALLLRPAALRADKRRVVLGLMVATAVLSGLVSNTATTVMMLPIALLLAERAGAGARGRSAFSLGLAYAASIGGVGTLVGTFPNVVFAEVAAEQAGVEVSFATWSAIGLPFVLGALPVAWFVVTRLLIEPGGPPAEAPPLPPWRTGERAVLGVVAVTMAAWISGVADDPWIAITAGVVLFVLPGDDGPLLDFRVAEQRLPWSVLFLLGGGFSLAATIRSSGLTEWLAGFTGPIASLPLPIAVGVICLVVTFLTELTSNTATTQILLPLLAAGAAQHGIDPVVWMVPATISASCAFMMPVATPPNAIAAQAGDVNPADMATAGLALNLALACWAAVIGLVVAPAILGS